MHMIMSRVWINRVVANALLGRKLSPASARHDWRVSAARSTDLVRRNRDLSLAIPDKPRSIGIPRSVPEPLARACGTNIEPRRGCSVAAPY
jgi:hypothetical protein